MQQKIDLNSDLGEGYGPYVLGDDEAILRIVSSANVACGFHAGDPEIMHRTFALAKASSVAIGAHPGFEDRAHFGRRRLPMTLAEIERVVAYQIGAACGIAALSGHQVTYVKAHGALGNWSSEDESVARAIARATRAVDRSLMYLAIAATAAERGARAEGLDVACEIFADRAYQPDGTLLPRGMPGAVLHNAEEVCVRVAQMLRAEAIVAVDGTRISTRIDSVCVHSDTNGAAGIALTLRKHLEADGFAVAPFVRLRASAEERE